MADNVILELKNITKTFNQGDSKLVILDDASFSIKRGEIVALIGPSGTGKSTLLYIAGLLDKASKGEVIIDGKNTHKLNDNQKTKLRCKKIGFVYQQHNLFADFTALENVMMPLLIAGVKKKRAVEIASVQLDKMGLSNRLNHKSSELSGGEQQRVAIARALANAPQLLLADEPTGNLDSKTSQDVLGLLKVTSKRFHQTIVMITHNEEIAQMADRILQIEDGKIVSDSGLV